MNGKKLGIRKVLPNEEICKLYDSGKTLTEIGVIYGVSPNPIRRVLLSAGIEIKLGKDRNTKGQFVLQRSVPTEELCKLYESGKSLAELGNIYGVSQKAVRIRLSRLGVKIRKQGGIPAPEPSWHEDAAYLREHGWTFRGIGEKLGFSRQAIYAALQARKKREK